jgi:hypothetical protein
VPLIIKNTLLGYLSDKLRAGFNSSDLDLLSGHPAAIAIEIRLPVHGKRAAEASCKCPPVQVSFCTVT